MFIPAVNETMKGKIAGAAATVIAPVYSAIDPDLKKTEKVVSVARHAALGAKKLVIGAAALDATLTLGLVVNSAVKGAPLSAETLALCAEMGAKGTLLFAGIIGTLLGIEAACCAAYNKINDAVSPYLPISKQSNDVNVEEVLGNGKYRLSNGQIVDFAKSLRLENGALTELAVGDGVFYRKKLFTGRGELFKAYRPYTTREGELKNRIARNPKLGGRDRELTPAEELQDKFTVAEQVALGRLDPDCFSKFKVSKHELSSQKERLLKAAYENLKNKIK